MNTQDGSSVHKYDLVATLAARLYCASGHSKTKSARMTEAARNALELLDICQAATSEHFESFYKLNQDPGQLVPGDEALLRITGENKIQTAKKKYQKFLEQTELYESREEQTQSAKQEILRILQHGMPAKWVEARRKSYECLRPVLINKVRQASGSLGGKTKARNAAKHSKKKD